ncbi:hypothetical protein L7F22_020698 [Adiantum nelumboides]|nr:hypothetical protein [Adiantum nelumboides]
MLTTSTLQKQVPQHKEVSETAKEWVRNQNTSRDTEKRDMKTNMVQEIQPERQFALNGLWKEVSDCINKLSLEMSRLAQSVPSVEKMLERQGLMTAYEVNKTNLRDDQAPVIRLECKIRKHWKTVDQATLDGGTGVNIMSKALRKHLDLKLKPAPLKLKMVDQSVTNPLGLVEEVPIRIARVKFETSFLVLDVGLWYVAECILAMLSPKWTMITTSCGDSCHGRLVMSCDTLPLRVAAIQKAGVIACVRAQSAGIALDMARAALDGGLNVLEVTMTTPSAQLAITKLVEEYPSALIGAGTVLSLADADLARAAGAKFLISPVTIENLIGSHRDGPMLVIPGAITPTEVFNAYNHGASLVKFRATVRKEISQVPLDVDFDLLKVGGPSSGSCGGSGQLVYFAREVPIRNNKEIPQGVPIFGAYRVPVYIAQGILATGAYRVPVYIT